MKHLLDIEHLTRQEIVTILDTAIPFKEVFTRGVKKVPALRGKTCVNLFFEPSTRTQHSFELAEKRLSADVINFSVTSSSVSKGETLVDTAKNIEAMASDIIVLRHGDPGAPYFLAKNVRSSIINAGDGSHAHPTQALLDLFTIREKKGGISGLKVVIVGDILHSRVARSNIWALKKMGAGVVVCGPPTLMPRDIARMGVEVSYDIDTALKGADIAYILRIQLERQEGGFLPSLTEYTKIFGLSEERLRRAPKNLMVMHPGPMNRGVEITPGVADGKNSVILDQVTNGVAVRMAILYLLVQQSVPGRKELETVD